MSISTCAPGFTCLYWLVSIGLHCAHVSRAAVCYTDAVLIILARVHAYTRLQCRRYAGLCEVNRRNHSDCLSLCRLERRIMTAIMSLLLYQAVHPRCTKCNVQATWKDCENDALLRFLLQTMRKSSVSDCLLAFTPHRHRHTHTHTHTQSISDQIWSIFLAAGTALRVYRWLIPRLHDTTGWQTGLRTGFTTGCIV